MTACVADTSPLIAFSGIGRLDVLRAVFSRVWVPPKVFAEIVTEGVGWFEAAEAQRELGRGDWMRVTDVSHGPLLDSLRLALGESGEAEAICLAVGRQLPVMLDEVFGRKVAVTAGATVVGSLGVLKKAKFLGTITEAKPFVTAMVQNGIYYDDKLIPHFLTDLGEA